MERISLHWGDNPRDFRRILSKGLESGVFSREDYEMVSSYIVMCANTEHIVGSTRTLKTYRIFNFKRRHLPDVNFSDVTSDVWNKSVEDFFSSELSPKTKNGMILTVRNFFLWAIKNGKITTDLTATEVKSVKLLKTNIRTKTEKDLITPDEIYQMLSAKSITPMSSAVIAMLYWTGCRAGELLSLRWQDLTFDGMVLEVVIPPFKANPERYVATAEALHYVAEWRNHYPKDIPGGATGENFVFVTKYNGQYRQMTVNNLYKCVRRLGQDVLHRDIHPHQFRASHITNMSAAGVSDMVNKLAHWGRLNTMMLDTYSIPSKDMIRKEFMRASGIIEEEKKASTEIIMCPVCGAQNVGNEHCRLCGAPLTPGAKQRNARQEENLSSIQRQFSATDMVSGLAKMMGAEPEEVLAALTKLVKK